MKKIIKPIIFVLLIAFIAIGPFGFHFAQADCFQMNGLVPSITVSECVTDALAAAGNLLLSFFGLFLAISGGLLDYVMTYTVVNMTTNITGIRAINEVWAVVRDLVNMSFIFILVYTAIQTILGIGGRKMKAVIVSVVIAAILINFSLFFTKLLIDASNTIALIFYNQLNGSGNSLSINLVNSLKLTTVYTSSTGVLEAGQNILFATILGSAFLVIATFTLLAGALMFIIRYVNIILLLMLSAFGFFGAILPGLGGYAKKWWEKLMGELLFAPIYMIMLWIVLKVINSPTFLGQTGRLSDAVANPASATAMGIVMNYIIVISLLMAVLIVSKQVAGQGGTAGQKIIGGAVGLGAATAGLAGRKFVGGAARGLAESERLKEKASEKGLSGMSARLALRTSNKAAGSSFDVRSSKALGAVGGAIGFDINKEIGAGRAGGSGGYDAMIRGKSQEKAKFAETLKTSDSVKERVVNDLKAEEAAYNERRVKAQKAHDEMLKGAGTEAKASVVEPVELQRARDNVKQLENEIRNPSTILSDVEIKDIEDKTRLAKEEMGRLEKEHKTNIELKTKEIMADKGASQIKELESATSDRSALDKAQRERDKVLGISEKEAKTRGIEAQASADTLRKETYAAGLVKPGLFGGTSRVGADAARAIRKSLKEKTPEQKLAEAAKEIAKKDIEENAKRAEKVELPKEGAGNESENPPKG